MDDNLGIIQLYLSLVIRRYTLSRAIKNNQTYFNFILQKVRDFLYVLAFCFCFFLVSFVCVNTKKTYKTKTTKGTRQNGMEDERETHSKDKFLNLNSDPNVGFANESSFWDFLPTRRGERERKRGRKRQSEMVFISVTNVFNLAEHKIQFSNVLFRQHFDLVSRSPSLSPPLALSRSRV